MQRQPRQSPLGKLTCFALAKPDKPGAVQVPAKVTSGDLPDVLAGRYRIERLIGAGGMGLVYKARDLLIEQFGDPNPYVAVKMLNQNFAELPGASALLYSEFALTRHLRHPNVVRVDSFEVDTHCQRAFITMELMDGLGLDELLCQQPLGLAWRELQDIALPLLDVLAYTHSQGVLHGDIKPSNLMLSDQGLRLYDFGLAQAEEGPLMGLPRLSRDRIIAWTPTYAAPEITKGHALCASADVYSAACVIYELVHGKHPFRRTASIKGRLARPERLPKHCWPALRTALASNPNNRTITAEQLRDVMSGQASWKRYLLGWR